MLRPVIVVENALSPEEVAACNAAIDASWDAEYIDGGGDTHPCRSGGHQSRAFFEMRGMLEWDKPHCLAFRNLLGHRSMVPYMNELLAPGWRMDHAPFVICGDGRRELTDEDRTNRVDRASVQTQERVERGNIGGFVHGHVWDPDYRYRYANDVMRAGQLAAVFQLTEMQEGWGGFGLVPGSESPCAYPSRLPLPWHEKR